MINSLSILMLMLAYHFVLHTVVACVSSVRATVLTNVASASISDVNQAALGVEVQTVLNDPRHADGWCVGVVVEALDRTGFVAANHQREGSQRDRHGDQRRRHCGTGRLIRRGDRRGDQHREDQQEGAQQRERDDHEPLGGLHRHLSHGCNVLRRYQIRSKVWPEYFSAIWA